MYSHICLVLLCIGSCLVNSSPANHEHGTGLASSKFNGIYQSFTVSHLFNDTGRACESCASTEKCCEPKGVSPFCAPENASCCGDAWCLDGFTCCKYGDSYGGCCPADVTCAVDSKGCCKRAGCIGPFTCYDFGSYECTHGSSVIKEKCCNAAYPYCRLDEKFGYGCFDVYANSQFPNVGDSQPLVTALPLLISGSGSSTSCVETATTTTPVLQSSEITAKSATHISIVASYPPIVASELVLGLNISNIPANASANNFQGTTTRSTGTLITGAGSVAIIGSTVTAGIRSTATIARGSAAPSQSSTDMGVAIANIGFGFGLSLVFVAFIGGLVAA